MAELAANAKRKNMALESSSVNYARVGQHKRNNHDHGAHDQNSEYRATQQAASCFNGGLDNTSVFYTHGGSICR
jgi:hypothetical protein